MINASLKICIPAEKRRDAIQTVRSILGWTSAQPGCISMVFYQDTNDPDSMMLFEEWEDWESLKSHIRSNAYRNILELMELSAKPPEIKLNTISSTKGMELIEEIRLGASQ